MPDDFVPALPMGELAEGALRACQVNGRALLLCRSAGAVYALDDLCTHAESRLSEGRLRRGRLVCPMHGAAFDPRDGAVLAGPATRALTCHEVRIRDGVIEVRPRGLPSATGGS